MMSATGWIRVYRSLLEHTLWLGERFTRGQAWLDLLLLAAWADHVSTAGNVPVEVMRGQVLTSQIKLAARWKWNRETVARFLSMLKSLSMIDIRTSKRTDTGYTLITILNYEEFQSADHIESSIQPGIGPDIESSIGQASDQHRAGTIKKGEQREEGTTPPVAPPAKPTLDDLVAKLAGREAYRGLDVRQAALNCWEWCQANRKIFSERRLVNWLNRETKRPQSRLVPTRAGLNDRWTGRVGGEVAL